MDLLSELKTMLVDILDVPEDEITRDAYLVRDLGAESIDLMELAVTINERFNLEIDEDAIFLRTLRQVVAEAGEDTIGRVAAIGRRFGFLSDARIDAILGDLENGPVLQVQDLIAYLESRLGDGACAA